MKEGARGVGPRECWRPKCRMKSNLSYWTPSPCRIVVFGPKNAVERANDEPYTVESDAEKFIIRGADVESVQRHTAPSWRDVEPPESTHNRLAVSMMHEVRELLVTEVAAATHAVAFTNVRGFPYALPVVVVACVGSMATRRRAERMVESRVARRLLEVPRIAHAVGGDSTVEPFVVLRVHGGRRVGVFRRTVTRVRRSQRSRVPRRIRPGRLVMAVCGLRWLAMLHTGQTLVFGNLLLVPRRIDVRVARA